MTNFADLGLSPALLKALEEEGYSTPTPIQAKAIPTVLAGTDLLGIAQTGTGKTAAFALPILQRLATNRRPAPRKGCRALILSPTRELATQIGESFEAYGRHLGFSVAVIFGGVGHRPQIQALARGIDILVATPGRLLDHMGERHASLEGTEILVLDEADQMLDLGFIVPIRRIVARLSERRQSLFFSATMPGEIGKLASELLKDPVRVSVAPAGTTVERVRQRVIHVEQNRKRALLVELMQQPGMSRVLVFTRTKRGADRVAKHLDQAGISVAAIHGNKSQGQRQAALEAFKAAKIQALVATDIAARGIDVESVTHVVNFELPDVPESYVHRIGRTARAGADGSAIALVAGDERDQLRDIERLTRQQIPAEDRRNDQTLTADPPRGGRAEGREDRRPRRDGDRRMGRNGERRQGGDERRAAHGDGRTSRPGGERRDAGQARGFERPADRGAHPARSGDREERREGGRLRVAGPDQQSHGHQHSGRADRSSEQRRPHGAGRPGEARVTARPGEHRTARPDDSPAPHQRREDRASGDRHSMAAIPFMAQHAPRNGEARKGNGQGNGAVRSREHGARPGRPWKSAGDRRPGDRQAGRT